MSTVLSDNDTVHRRCCFLSGIPSPLRRSHNLVFTTAAKMSRAIFDDLDLKEVKFLERLNKGEFSKIFRVEARGQVCVLKVVGLRLATGCALFTLW